MLEKVASAREGGTKNATGGFIKDAQTSNMETQMQARRILKGEQKPFLMQIAYGSIIKSCFGQRFAEGCSFTKHQITEIL